MSPARTVKGLVKENFGVSLLSLILVVVGGYLGYTVNTSHEIMREQVTEYKEGTTQKLQGLEEETQIKFSQLQEAMREIGEQQDSLRDSMVRMDTTLKIHVIPMLKELKEKQNGD